MFINVNIFILLVLVSLCFHSYKLFIFKGASSEQYERRTEGILRIQPPRLDNVTLIVQYISNFLTIKEYIVQSFNFSPCIRNIIAQNQYIAQSY